jgi:MFS family permease
VSGDEPTSDRAVQRRILTVLSIGQVLSGVGLGAGISLGALLLGRLADDESVSGLAATAGTLGAALFAIPLASLAQRSGRRPSLGLGAAIGAAGAVGVIGSAFLSSPVLLIVALLVLGAGNAVNLQARFAAVDLATVEHRGRDLSLVVWMTTVGVVVGPNLVAPGEVVGEALGLPVLTGAFLITVVCQALAALLYFAALRPDPLRLLADARRRLGETPRVRIRMLASFRMSSARTRSSIAIVALGHAVMVAVMAMTPVHLTHQGAGLQIIGLTLSLHTFGMYGLSPVFGWLSDRIGRERVVLGGQVMTAASLILSWIAPNSQVAVVVALILLGFGWSATVIAGSALVAGSTTAVDRPAIQGVSDTIMNFAGALAGAGGGLVLAAIGFAGLNAVGLVLVAAGAVLALRLSPGDDAGVRGRRYDPPEADR